MVRRDFYVIGKFLADQNDLNQHVHQVYMLSKQARGKARIAKQIKGKTDMVLVELGSLRKKQKKKPKSNAMLVNF